MKHPFFPAAVLSLMLLGSCSTARFPGDGRGNPYPEERDEKDREKGVRRDRGEEGNSYPFSSLGIPKGHLPPPGECKIWYPGKPAGHQPPPQSCASAIGNAPLGAWVVTHEGERYRVSIFSKTKKGLVDEVRYYLSR